MKEKFERPRFLKLIARLLSRKCFPNKPNQNRVITTESGLKVELSERYPDDYAEVIAKVFKTGNSVIGTFNEETGKFDIKNLD